MSAHGGQCRRFKGCAVRCCTIATHEILVQNGDTANSSSHKRDSREGPINESWHGGAVQMLRSAAPFPDKRRTAFWASPVSGQGRGRASVEALHLESRRASSKHTRCRGVNFHHPSSSRPWRSYRFMEVEMTSDVVSVLRPVIFLFML